MPNSTIVGYARVSSVDQNLDRQLVQLKTENVENFLLIRFLVRTWIVRDFLR